MANPLKMLKLKMQSAQFIQEYAAYTSARVIYEFALDWLGTEDEGNGNLHERDANSPRTGIRVD